MTDEIYIMLPNEQGRAVTLKGKILERTDESVRVKVARSDERYKKLRVIDFPSWYTFRRVKDDVVA